VKSRYFALLFAVIVACTPATTDQIAGDAASLLAVKAAQYQSAAGEDKVLRPSRAKLGRAHVQKVRGRTASPGVPVAITVPMACDWISPSSNWRDRKDALCGALELQPGAHRIAARISGLDTRVADEVADADAFGWGPRLLTRQGAPLIVGADVYVTYKGGNYTPCSTVGPTDPCGPDLWDERVYGVRAYRWVSGQLALQWEYASDWTPPGVNILSQSWEPVFQPVISGLFIYVQEGRGQISRIDRAAGLVVETISSPETTDLTFVAAPPAVADGGTVFFTSMTLNAADPYTADSSWLIRHARNGDRIVKSVNDLVSNRPATCQLTFAFASPRPALPWPPGPGAQAPSFPTGAFRFAVNATPAISLNGQSVAVVARSRQCGDTASMLSVNSVTLDKHWEYSLEHTEADGCGPKRNQDGTPSQYLTPDTATASETGNSLDCRVGSTVGVALKRGGIPGNFVNELSTSAPVSMIGDMVALGTYSNHDNERGHVKVIGFNGVPHRTFNFGWNYNPAVIHDENFQSRLVLIDGHYDNGPYSVATYGVFAQFPVWEHVQTSNRECIRSGGTGDLYDCQQLPPYTAPSAGQSLKRLMFFGANPSVRDVEFSPSYFPFVPRQPAVTADRNVWVSGTDGVARLLDGHSGKQIAEVQVDSALNQADVPMSLDSAGKLYLMQNGQLVVVGKR